MDIYKLITEALQDLANPEKKVFFPKFFKAGKGEYAEGDLFIGVTVPMQRLVVKEYWKSATLEDIAKLLLSPYHEYRHTGALILVEKFQKAKTPETRREIIDFYLLYRHRFNNWDIVDNSVYKILGRYAYEENKPYILWELSLEENIWSKRMAIVGTMFHVKKGDFELMEQIIIKNLSHPHDLIHKANGWLLREMGEQNESRLLHFLHQHYKKMPRTSLRYAIEKFSPEVRQKLLKGDFENLI